MEKLIFIKTLSHDDIIKTISGALETCVDHIDYEPSTCDISTVDDVVNNFPADFNVQDFVNAVETLVNETACKNKGLWWEVLETCLAERTMDDETSLLDDEKPLMQIFVMYYERELTLDEVIEITGTVMKEFVANETADMDEDEVCELINETLEDYDEDVDVETDEMFEVVCDEVNNFPAIATGKDFIEVINRLIEKTANGNPGLWWEVLETCLAERVGRKNNCLS